MGIKAIRNFLIGLLIQVIYESIERLNMDLPYFSTILGRLGSLYHF